MANRNKQKILNKIAAEREKIIKDSNARMFFATNSIISEWIKKNPEEVTVLAGSLDTTNWTQAQWETIFKRVEESEAYAEYLNTELFFKSNLRAAEIFLFNYLAETRDDVYSETIRAAVLYFFATFDDVKPSAYDGLTDKHKEELKDIFSRIDAFYIARDDMRMRSGQELAKAFIDNESHSNTANNAMLEHFKQEKVDEITLSLDKANSVIWGFGKETFGEIPIKAEGSNGKDKQQIDIIYSISFDELEDNIKIQRHTDYYDERVYTAVGALWEVGNDVFSLTQIHKNMGYTSKPDTNAISRIRKSVIKMMKANISISNEQEVAAKYNYDKFIYHGSLLPCEFVDGIIGGQVVDTAIHLFREPPLLTFAKQRKQVTTIHKCLLQSPVNKTTGNLQIESYLLKRIARAKNGTQPRKILLKTFYERTQLTTSKQRTRGIEKVKAYLDWYKKRNYIRDYSIDQDSITIRL